jgi:hypothetical protein
MRNISRRIDTVEKQLSLGQHEKQIRLLPPIISSTPTNSTGKDIDKLGPVETWITYQEQLQAQKKANAELLKDNPNSLGAPIIIDMDVEKEYRARATKSNQKPPNAGK